ncbi:MAG: DoxX family protein [Betaproteobacteria bacterium]|nr:DoxX family protein [Betaproteobacteria bacterium]
MPQAISNLIRRFSTLNAGLEHWLTPLFDLGIRLYVANVFWSSGLVKISDWGSTLALFEYEYHVPVLPPHLAAYLAASGELGLSVLLVLGLAGRFGAAGLFVVNLVAVLSYPDLSDLGRADHLLWGVLLLVALLHGPGRLSVDYWLLRWLNRDNHKTP